MAHLIQSLLFLRLDEVEVLNSGDRVLLCRLGLEHFGACLIRQVRIVVQDSSLELPIFLLVDQLGLGFLPLACQFLLHEVSGDAHARDHCGFPLLDCSFELAHSHRVRFLIVSLILAVL